MCGLMFLIWYNHLTLSTQPACNKQTKNEEIVASVDADDSTSCLLHGVKEQTKLVRKRKDI